VEEGRLLKMRRGYRFEGSGNLLKIYGLFRGEGEGGKVEGIRKGGRGI
jgi:hypothetical protein